MNNIFTISVSDILARRVLIVRDCVVGHNGRCHTRTAFEFEGSLGKGQQVFVEVISGIDGIFSESKVCITTCLACTSAGPVLSHSIHAILAPSTLQSILACRCLESVSICTCNIRSQLRAFAKCMHHTTPTRVGREVNLGRKCRSNTKMTILRRGNISESTNNGKDRKPRMDLCKPCIR